MANHVNIDYLGQTMELGDIVAFNPPGAPGIKRGKIIRLTPLGVTIGHSVLSVKSTNRPNGQVIKINEQVAIAKEKYPENFI